MDASYAFFISKDGSEIGPVSERALLRLFRGREIDSETPIRRTDWAGPKSFRTYQVERAWGERRGPGRTKPSIPTPTKGVGSTSGAKSFQLQAPNSVLYSSLAVSVRPWVLSLVTLFIFGMSGFQVWELSGRPGLRGDSFLGSPMWLGQSGLNPRFGRGGRLSEVKMFAAYGFDAKLRLRLHSPAAKNVSGEDIILESESQLKNGQAIWRNFRFESGSVAARGEYDVQVMVTDAEARNLLASLFLNKDQIRHPSKLVVHPKGHKVLKRELAAVSKKRAKVNDGRRDELHQRLSSLLYIGRDIGQQFLEVARASKSQRVKLLKSFETKYLQSYGRFLSDFHIGGETVPGEDRMILKWTGKSQGLAVALGRVSMQVLEKLRKAPRAPVGKLESMIAKAFNPLEEQISKGLQALKARSAK